MTSDSTLCITNFDVLNIRCRVRELAQSSLLGKITRNNFTPNRYMHNIHANISIHSTLHSALQSSLKINNLDTCYFIQDELLMPQEQA